MSLKEKFFMENNNIMNKNYSSNNMKKQKNIVEYREHFFTKKTKKVSLKEFIKLAKQDQPIIKKWRKDKDEGFVSSPTLRVLSPVYTQDMVVKPYFDFDYKVEQPLVLNKR